MDLCLLVNGVINMALDFVCADNMKLNYITMSSCPLGLLYVFHVICLFIYSSFPSWF